MEPGQVVEFIDNQKIFCAVVLEIKNLRLRLLAENNRETKMSVARLTHRSKQRLAPSLGRDKLVAGLKEISTRRKSLSQQIDIQNLWEVLNTEQEWIDLPTMTGLCFPDEAGGDHESAVIRAFFDDRLYFKFGADRFFPHTVDKVAQITEQREKASREVRIIEQASQWIQRANKGQNVAPPADAEAIIKILGSYCLYEKESPHREIARVILKKADINTPAAIFNFLVKIGAWQPDENLDLLRHEIRLTMPEAVTRHAEALCQNPPLSDTLRRDLCHLPTITIDGIGTQDFDDALSIEADGDNFCLGIHIADVGHYIAKGDPVDIEASRRVSSIYTPDRKISMLPACLCLDLCSLKANVQRAAISTLVTISPQGLVLDYEIVPSTICVDRQLTYQDADELALNDALVKALHNAAVNYRERRLDNGALIIDLPEINIWLNSAGAPEFLRVDRKSPAHLLVAELMILANDLAARFLSGHNLPAIFRSQPEPRERLFERSNGSLYQNWMQRRFINRFSLGIAAEPHAGLGLPAYTTCTSPIRKYTDLVTQRQLRAALGMETAYSQEEMSAILSALEQPAQLVGRIQYSRHRYWLLKYLEGRIGSKLEAYVLNKRRDGYVILIPEYMIECNLSGAENVSLKPEDLIQVTIQHVNARNDIVNVYLG